MNKDILELIPIVISGIFVIMSAVISCYTVIGKFSEIIGKPVKWVKDKQNDHELLIKTSQNLYALQKKHNEDVKQSIRHDEMIKLDISSLTDTVNEIADTLSDMQKKIDHTEMAKLKDQILSYYKKYKDIGEWDEFESDVFWGLYDSYISHGGNSFVKQDIEPVMRDLNIKK